MLPSVFSGSPPPKKTKKQKDKTRYTPDIESSIFNIRRDKLSKQELKLAKAGLGSRPIINDSKNYNIDFGFGRKTPKSKTKKSKITTPKLKLF